MFNISYFAIVLLVSGGFLFFIKSSLILNQSSINCVPRIGKI